MPPDPVGVGVGVGVLCLEEPVVDLNHGGARLVCDLGLANTNTHAAHKNSTTACNNFCFLRKQRKKNRKKKKNGKETQRKMNR